MRLTNRLNSTEEIYTLSNLASVNTDIILMLCGEKIGSGATRAVYEYNMNPKKFVVKIEPLDINDCNLQEYLLWQEIKGLTGNLAWVKDWFAPVHYCSPNGKVLIMERTYPPSQLTGNLPKKVPEFMSDIKLQNFGWIGKKFVCHDYGFIYKFIKYEKKFKVVTPCEW